MVKIIGNNKKKLNYVLSLSVTLKQKVNGVWMIMVKVIRGKVIKEFIYIVYIACGEYEDADEKEWTRTRARQ